VNVNRPLDLRSRANSPMSDCMSSTVRAPFALE
jgi:hypothetical protein